MNSLNHFSDSNNALEWYKYGLERGNDFFGRFIMHWIAFNWLYAETYRQGERENIKAYCKANEHRLKKYDAFSTEAIQVFMQQPVRDSLRGYKRLDVFQNLKRNNSIEALLLTIYQVRCNLFHGLKNIHRDRDIQLVRASAEIMEGYLKALLDI